MLIVPCWRRSSRPLLIANLSQIIDVVQNSKKFPKAFAYFPQVGLLSRLVSLTVKVLLTQQRRSHVRTEAVVALAPNWPLKEALGPGGVAHDHLK